MKYICKRMIIKVMALLVTLSSSAWAEKLPGEGIYVQPIRSTLSEEIFQTLIVNKAMQALGYTLKKTEALEYDEAYRSIATGDASYFAVNWDPLHNGKYKKAGGSDKLSRKGVYISGAGQGYLIDKKTAKKYNITNISQLRDPNMARLFDINGDGTADLAGCNPGWGCEGVIEHQLDSFGLRQTVTHNQGDYSTIMASTIERYKKGNSIFYYTWTPYWVSGVLVPDKDVIWLEVPFSSLPGDRRDIDTSLFNGKNYGFQMNSIRILANKKFIDDNPAAAKLFELMKLDINDVSAENMLMAKGANGSKDIEEHANNWIKAHQKEFDTWILSATDAATQRQ